MRRKCSLVMFLALVISLMSNTVVLGAEKNENLEISELIPKAATDYVKSQYETILEVSKDCFSNLSMIDEEKCILETPFVIYDLSNTEWGEVYYYPISYDEQIVLVVSVINTIDGWTTSATDEYVIYLNQIDYIDNPSPVFYSNREQVFAVSEDNSIETVNLSDKKDSVMKEFAIGNYKEIKSDIIGKIDDMVPVDTESVVKKDIEEYTPTYGLDRLTGSDIGRICSHL